MAMFSLTSENPCGFSACCLLAELSAKPRNYLQPRPLNEPSEKKTKIFDVCALGIAHPFLLLNFEIVNASHL